MRYTMVNGVWRCRVTVGLVSIELQDTDIDKLSRDAMELYSELIRIQKE